VIAGRRAPARALDTAMDELDARLHRIGQHPFARSSGCGAGTARWSTCAASRPSVDTPKSWSGAQVGPGPAAQRRPSDALPWASGVRRAARHRDMLPRLPGALARHPPGDALDDAERGYVVEAIYRVDRGAVRPPQPAAVAESGRHRGLTDLGGGGTTSPATPRGPTTRTDLDFGTVTMSATGSTVGVFAALSAQSRDGVPALRRPDPPDSAAPDVGWEQRGRRRPACAVLVGWPWGYVISQPGFADPNSTFTKLPAVRKTLLAN